MDVKRVNNRVVFEKERETKLYKSYRRGGEIMLQDHHPQQRRR